MTLEQVLVDKDLYMVLCAVSVAVCVALIFLVRKVRKQRKQIEEMSWMMNMIGEALTPDLKRRLSRRGIDVKRVDEEVGGKED